MSFPARQIGAGVLLALPLFVGTGIVAATQPDIATSWDAAGASAPVSADKGDSLIDARKAVTDASGQAGLLKNGSGQLAKGTGELKEGSQPLRDGGAQARDGAAQLSQGMVQLQAATGQMGAGAQEIADGVAPVVDNIVGLEAVRGQILGTLDRSLGDLKDAKDPKSAETRKQLTSFRDQVLSFELDAKTREDLLRLRDGSRELANQLNTPGYAYHDGIYTATKGAQELSAGLNQLSAGLDQAAAGVDELDKGAKRLDGMAERNSQKIAEVRRALPAPAAGTEEANAQDVRRTLAPLYAFLIAAGVLLASAGRRFTPVLGVATGAVLSVLAGVLAMILGSGIGLPAAAGVAGIAALTIAASVLGTLVLQRLLPKAGTGIAIGLAVLQAGVVGWVWDAAATAQLSSAWNAAAALLPLHYATAGISSVGNAGSGGIIGLSAGVLSALALAALGALGLLRERK